MTRINVIDPTQLTDQHLMAEYRELPMVMGSLRRSLRSKNGLPMSGCSYTLNAGHVKFFYNRGKFLYKRYNALVDELFRRGFNLSEDRAVDFTVFKQNGLFNDWIPDQNAFLINRARIQERILAKPDWYRYYGKPIKETPEYLDLLIPTKVWRVHHDHGTGNYNMDWQYTQLQVYPVKRQTLDVGIL